MVNDRYQVCPSTEVLKWLSGQDLLKLSSNETFDRAAVNDEQEEAIRAPMKRRVAIEEALLSILCGGIEIRGFPAVSLRRNGQ